MGGRAAREAGGVPWTRGKDTTEPRLRTQRAERQGVPSREDDACFSHGITRRMFLLRD